MTTRSLSAFVLALVVSLVGYFATGAVAAPHWRTARCTATYRAWRAHHRHANATRRLAVMGALDVHHGCSLAPSRKAVPLATAPAPTAPLPAPAVATPKPTHAPTATPVATPLTVANVCGLNPGIGEAHPTNISGYPSVYWVNASNQVDILAYSDNGDTAVDVAAVFWPQPDGEDPIAFIAECTWSEWINVAELQQQEQQAGLTTYDPGSQSWWAELAPSMEALNGLALEDYSPTIGESVCNFDTSEECDYELDP